MSNRIPTREATGAKTLYFSSPAIEKLESEGVVTVRRGRRGQIMSARFLPPPRHRPAESKPRLSIPTGTYFSFEERLGDHSAWQHKPLLTLSDLDRILGERVIDDAELHVFLFTISRSVMLSCMMLPKPLAIIREALSLMHGPRKAAQRKADWKRKGLA